MQQVLEDAEEYVPITLTSAALLWFGVILSWMIVSGAWWLLKALWRWNGKI